MVHWKAASCELYCREVVLRTGPKVVQVGAQAENDFFGLSSLPVLAAGQCSVQRPHSTQE